MQQPTNNNKGKRTICTDRNTKTQKETTTMATRKVNENEATAADFGDTDTQATNLPAPANNSPMHLGAVEGEVNPMDMKLPRLQMAYGVGGLSENFNPGDLVLGGEYLLAKKGEPLRIVLLNVKKYYKQYLTREDYDAGVIPATYNSESEVLQNGGTTRWINGVGPSFTSAMNLKILIEKPEDLICGLFGIDLGGGKVYAPAVWDVDKSAYARVGPAVLTSINFALRERGMLSGVFEVSSRTDKINGNMTPVPTIRLVDHLSDEEIEAIKSLFSK